MKLMSVSKWIERYFVPGSEPPDSTVRRWLRQGDIPARKVGGTWFIDEEAWLETEVDVLVERIMRAG